MAVLQRDSMCGIHSPDFSLESRLNLQRMPALYFYIRNRFALTLRQLSVAIRRDPDKLPPNEIQIINSN
jgi:hypothetical protein